MKSIKIILLGIAVILFGIACTEATVFMTYSNEGYAFFEGVGVIGPFIGLSITLVGLFIKMNKD